MKNQILTLSLGLMSVIAFGQKKELRSVEKLVDKEQLKEARVIIESLESMESTMDSKYKAKYYYLRGAAYGKSNIEEAVESYNKLFAYEKESGKLKYTKEAKPKLNDLIQFVSKKAIEQYNSKDYAGAVNNFYMTYKLSPKDTTFLYNAALSASLSKNYDTSLEYYRELKNIGYTGVTTQYFAVNKKTGEVENLGSKSNRDTMIKLGQHSTPTNTTSDSKQADIVKNIGYILVNQGKTEEAIVALQEARLANPKDVNLILNEAQLYIKLEQMDKFGALMEDAVKLDPTNPTLFFNLGVVNANEGKSKEAIDFYKKAIELDPEYGDAYMNLAVTMLEKEKGIVEQMNKNLSNFKKYEELKGQQKELYKKTLPFLLKADNIKRSEGTVRTLLNIYDTLGMEKEADALRPIFKEMRGM